MTTMSEPALASPSNPRIKAAARLRDRRERDATGLTLVDGARELRRALEAGVEVVEAFVCEPLLAGEDARVALDALRSRNVAVTTDHRSRLRQARVRRPCRGPRCGRSCAVARPRPIWRCPPTRWSSSSKASRSPATSGRCCAARTVPASMRSSPPRRARTSRTRTSSGRAPARSSRSRWPPLRRTRSSRWLRDRRIRIVAARVDATDAYTEMDLAGPRRHRAGLRGGRTHGRLARAGHRGHPPPDARRRRQPERLRHGRHPRCTRRAGNAPVIRPRQTDAMSTSFDFVVIGAGPGGEAAANKARELGATVAVVDRRWFGGSCPHIGCIPSKSLLHGADEHAQEPGRLRMAARLCPTRLHGQSLGRRGRARRHRPRHGARGGRRDRVPRRRPDRRPRRRHDQPRRRRRTS